MRQIPRVKDAYDITKMSSLVIDENETLVNVIKSFVKNPDLRGIFLVDKKKVLKGSITRTDLLNIVKVKLGKDIDEIPLRILRLKHLSDIKVSEIASMFSQRAGVKLGDSLDRALDLMINMDLIDIPVLDDNNKIIGDLTLSEILLKLMT